MSPTSYQLLHPAIYIFWVLKYYTTLKDILQVFFKRILILLYQQHGNPFAVLLVLLLLFKIFAVPNKKSIYRIYFSTEVGLAQFMCIEQFYKLCGVKIFFCRFACKGGLYRIIILFLTKPLAYRNGEAQFILLRGNGRQGFFCPPLPA